MRTWADEVVGFFHAQRAARKRERKPCALQQRLNQAVFERAVQELAHINDAAERDAYESSLDD